MSYIVTYFFTTTNNNLGQLFLETKEMLSLLSMLSFSFFYDNEGQILGLLLI